MSELKKGIRTRGLSSSIDALRGICDVIEDRIEPEIERAGDDTEGLRPSVGILKEVACAYGSTNSPDKHGLDAGLLKSRISQLESDVSPFIRMDTVQRQEMEAIEAADSSSTALGVAKRNVCDIVEREIEPRSQEVVDVHMEVLGARESPYNELMIKTLAVDNSISAIKKIACEGSSDVREEVRGLEQFVDTVHFFDQTRAQPAPKTRVVYKKDVPELQQTTQEQIDEAMRQELNLPFEDEEG